MNTAVKFEVDSKEGTMTKVLESFEDRHIGPQEAEVQEMLATLGFKSLDSFIEAVVPKTIRQTKDLTLSAFPQAKTEFEVLQWIGRIAKKNKVCRSFIGLGYSDCITPPVILRNILENPGWYTQYTPYQPEISQGRLEALLNYQTMVTDLTGLDIANASLLDEATAAAEAMNLCLNIFEKDHAGEAATFFVAKDCHPQTIDVVKTRAKALGVAVVVGESERLLNETKVCGALLQYPTTSGNLVDYRQVIEKVHAQGGLVTLATDLLALTLIASPGELGADIAIGNSQRFGVPMGFGGPHAAFFATKDAYKRQMPGRLVGVSKDADGKPALRLALQTREQHIRREKATSNICTAQVLLAIMASMYAVYHGPQGLKRIAKSVHEKAGRLAKGLKAQGIKIVHEVFFDTVQIEISGAARSSAIERAEKAGLNFRIDDTRSIGIALDETTSEADLESIIQAVVGKKCDLGSPNSDSPIPTSLQRSGDILTHPVFRTYHSETEFLRYVRRLESRDLSLGTAMIPLGSCTMKLNATSEMIPVTWPEFAGMHPFAPREQSKGYDEIFAGLEAALREITGFDAVSLQPNAGSQGEYAGLLAIREYHESRGDKDRTICLIPVSAHGTNPASAVMAGMEVVVVACDEQGNIDVADLRKKAAEQGKKLAALMATYPSTHGVFEESIKEVCEIVHAQGGQVYMDGANLNALVGLCRPADIGADVCHINLHKTFCIPHGGGGPGMGPIGVKSHLAPFLPGHVLADVGRGRMEGAVSAAPWGSAAILPIPWVYIALMGGAGLTQATKIAIVNANYLAKKLDSAYPVLYKGKNGLVAHECIVDVRSLKKTSGIEVEDVAKRLMDYGFHAPTVSFPVPGTLMIEPTESESKQELDRFIDAMLRIRDEIKDIETGKMPQDDNCLKNAPHTATFVTKTEWTHPYTREQAAFPAPAQKDFKFWPSVRRIDGSYGDRNLICSCPPLDSY